MSMIRLDSERFERRTKEIRRVLDGPLVVMLGRSQDVAELRINSALFLYLLGYEFPETILVVGETCTAVTSARKAEILRQIRGLNVVVRSKDGAGMESVYGMLKGPHYVVGSSEVQGEFCRNVLERIDATDATEEVSKVFLAKDDDEVENCRRSGSVASVLLRRAMEMLWDGVFERSKLEEMMGSEVAGVDMSLAEFSFPVEHGRDRVRIGVRYNGYCSEVSRTIIADMGQAYAAQDYVLGLVRPGVESCKVYSSAEKYFESNGLEFADDFLYSVGLMSRETSFREPFVVERGCVFVVRLSNERVSLSNTFVVVDEPEYLTSRDSAFDFVDKRSRFRDKTRDYELDVRRKEHQKELLDKLIEERLEFYRNLEEEGGSEDVKDEQTAPYGKESLVPRQGRVVVDFSRGAVVVPIGSYAVPFHVSSIKSVAVADERSLRINFKAEGKEREGQEEADEGCKGMLSMIKSISIRGSNSRELAEEINSLKKGHLVRGPEQRVESGEELQTKQRPFGLADVYMRTGTKAGARRRKTGTLELHENGFRFGEENVEILFSNIRHIFFSEGDVETSTILHFHLASPIVAGGRVVNVQFYQEAGSAVVYDTMKRRDEHMEYIVEKEEMDRQETINRRFEEFVRRIESETHFKVQVPRDGFEGVPFRENVMIKQTHECLVSLDVAPYLVITLEDVEVVNFERVVLTVKTVDVLFILKNRQSVQMAMKNKSRLLVSVLGVDVQNVRKLKEYLDSNNVLFMETSATIRWSNVIGSILKDPVSFYEDGAWSGLMVGDSEESEESEQSEESEEASDSGTEDLSTDDDVSDVSSEDPDEDESYDDDDDDDDSEDDSEEDDEPRKRRRN